MEKELNFTMKEKWGCRRKENEWKKMCWVQKKKKKKEGW